MTTEGLFNLKFSFDGSAFFRDSGMTKGSDIYSTSSGKIIRKVPAMQVVTTSAVAPLFFFRSDKDITIYNYQNDSSKTYPLPSGMSFPIIVSPRGSFTAYNTKNSLHAFDVYLHRNDTSHHYLLKKNVQNNVDTDFDNDESVVVAAGKSYLGSDPQAKSYIYKINELVATQEEQKPYLTFTTGGAAAVSADGKRLAIRNRISGQGELYDIATKRLLLSFEVPQWDFMTLRFLSPTVLTIQQEYVKHAQLYNFDAQPYQIIKIDRNLLRTLFCQKNMKVAYALHIQDPENKFTTIYPIVMVDIPNMTRCLLHQYNSRVSTTYDFDIQGNFFYANRSGIYQLMIDPTDCTPYQLFFLMAMGVATQQSHKEDRASQYAQLYKSPILATFPSPAQEYLEGILRPAPAMKSCPVAPSSSSSSNSLLRQGSGGHASSTSSGSKK